MLNFSTIQLPAVYQNARNEMASGVANAHSAVRIAALPIALSNTLLFAALTIGTIAELAFKAIANLMGSMIGHKECSFENALLDIAFLPYYCIKAALVIPLHIVVSLLVTTPGLFFAPKRADEVFPQNI